MAFPVVEGVALSSSGSGGAISTKTINLPASIAVGELLFILIHERNAVTWTMAGGWALARAQTAGLGAGGKVLWKVADGSEGATQAFSTGSSRFASIAYRISAVHVTAASFFSITSTDTLNPPSLAAGWGADDNLWIVVGGNVPSSGTVTPPTGYSSPASISRAGNTNNNNFPKVAAAWREFAGSPEDPAAWVFGGENSGLASFTIAVRPEPQPVPGGGWGMIPVGI